MFGISKNWWTFFFYCHLLQNKTIKKPLPNYNRLSVFRTRKEESKNERKRKRKKTEKIVQRKHQKFVCFSFVKYTECDYVRRTHLFLFFEKLYAWTSKDTEVHTCPLPCVTQAYVKIPKPFKSNKIKVSIVCGCTLCVFADGVGSVFVEVYCFKPGTNKEIFMHRLASSNNCFLLQNTLWIGWKNKRKYRKRGKIQKQTTFSSPNSNYKAFQEKKQEFCLLVVYSLFLTWYKFITILAFDITATTTKCQPTINLKKREQKGPCLESLNNFPVLLFSFFLSLPLFEQQNESQQKYFNFDFAQLVCAQRAHNIIFFIQFFVKYVNNKEKIHQQIFPL